MDWSSSVTHMMLYHNSIACHSLKIKLYIKVIDFCFPLKIRRCGHLQPKSIGTQLWLLLSEPRLALWTHQKRGEGWGISCEGFPAPPRPQGPGRIFMGSFAKLGAIGHHWSAGLENWFSVHRWSSLQLIQVSYLHLMLNSARAWGFSEVLRTESSPFFHTPKWFQRESSVDTLDLSVDQ